jgi:hypothetical protein
MRNHADGLRKQDEPDLDALTFRSLPAPLSRRAIVGKIRPRPSERLEK